MKKSTSFVSFVMVSLCISNQGLTQVQQDWAQRLYSTNPGQDNFGKMLADPSGNIYITGSATISSNQDAVLAKYNSAGVLQWSSTYNGLANAADAGNCITRDGSGNLYVGGYNSDPVKGSEVLTLKYNSSGALQWAARFHLSPTFTFEQARDIAVDNSGNIYVLGECPTSNSGLGSPTAAVLLKYSPDGILLWSQAYQLTSTDKAIPKELKLDEGGNPVGLIQSASDIVTLKYGSAGNMMWLQRYSATTTSNEYVSGLSVDESSGNIYVVGGNQQDIILLKYTSSGVPYWTRTYNNPATSFDFASDIELDASGNILIGGYTYINSLRSVCHFLAIKYNSAGILQWQSIYAPSSKSFELGLSMALDKSGNVYITGLDQTDNLSYILTVKLSITGALEWYIRYTGPYNRNDVRDIVTYTSNSVFQPKTFVYVGGVARITESTSDMITIKYSQPQSNTITFLPKEVPLPASPIYQ